MAKVTLDILLKDGEDSTAFGNSFSSNSDVEVKNPMVAIPTLITLNVEESYIDTIKADSRVLAADRGDEPCLPAGVVPGFTSVGPKTVVASSSDVSTSNNGHSYMPLQMYLDQDNMDGATLASKTYQCYLGLYTGYPNNPGVWTMTLGSDITGSIASSTSLQTNKTIRVYEGCSIKIYPHGKAHYGFITSVSGNAYQMNYQDRNNLYVIGQNLTSNPTFNIEVGDTIDFFNETDTTGHPFYIKTTNSTGTGDLVTTGTVYGQGSTGVADYSMSAGWNTGTGTTVVPGTYYYQCENHAGMGGQIIVHAAGALYNHPLYLKTAASTGTGDQVSGVTNQGTNTSDLPLEYTFPEGSAGTYYYQCSLHAAMSGQIIVTSGGNNIKTGKNSTDFATKIPDRTYSSRWTGKFVDIVTCEAGSSTMLAANYHTNHSDFDDLDNPGTTRMIAKDWSPYGLDSDRNKDQVTTGVMNTTHGMGVLSVAGGTVCGFAKKAKLYQTTGGGTNSNTTTEIINGIVAWHNSKTGNPDNNNLVDPTIIIGEVQWLKGRKIAFPIESVGEIKSPSGNVTRPGSGWGTNFSEFVNRDIIPWQVKDPDTNTFVWCVVLPDNAEYVTINTAIDAAWDAGVIFIGAAGNDGGCYVKTSDARYNGEYFRIDANSTKYTNVPNNWTVAWNKSTTSGSVEDHYPWRNAGIHGRDKAIDVAAGRNSESWPGLDTYSNRGPGIDIIGRGATTWSSYPSTTYADGKDWGWFSGTSCATPTVVGKAACLMEEYMTYNNAWPTPAQIKEILLSQADRNNYQESWDGVRRGLHPSNAKMVKDAGGFDWTSVPAANSHITTTTSHGYSSINKMQAGTGMNGSVAYIDLAGTTRRFCSYDTKGFNRSQTRGPRPKSGGVYPRPRIQRHKIPPEFA